MIQELAKLAELFCFPSLLHGSSPGSSIDKAQLTIDDEEDEVIVRCPLSIANCFPFHLSTRAEVVEHNSFKRKPEASSNRQKADA